jgi:hypothetical protein
LRYLALLASLLPALTCAAAAPPRSETVAQALERLNSASLRFIYSTQLVPDSLRVEQAPLAGEPLAQARAILAAHGLTLVPVSATLYAVAANPRRGTPAVSAKITDTAPTAPSVADGRESISVTPTVEAIISAQRNPFGLKSADDGVLYSATRLSGQPVLGEDALISLTRMPGISQGDISGRLNIRGGGPDETLILLDGFPLRQPWHMPGYRGVLSIIDPGALRQVGLYQGAIPARYGDRMSGVLDLQTLAPLAEPRHSLGAGFLNGRWRSDTPLSPGSSNDLLIAARYGATGYLTKAMQPAAGNPRYGDVLARLRVVTEPDANLVFNALLSNDTLSMNRSGLDERSNMRSSSAYFWMQADHTLPLPHDEDARVSLWFGHTRFESGRDGVLNSQGLATGSLDEDRHADIWDLRLRLDWAWSTRHLLESGLNFTVGEATYRYDSAVSHTPELAAVLGVPTRNVQHTDVRADRRSGAAFVSDSWAIVPGLTAQLGLRLLFADSPDAAGISRWDPRLALAWEAAPATTLHAGWGRVHQVSDLTDLGPQRDASTEIVAQRTEYRLLGIDHMLREDTLLRVEAFDKSQLYLTPQLRNLLRSPSILPELSFDRMWFAPWAVEIRGVEMTLQQSLEHWRWSAAWAYSVRREVLGTAPLSDRRQRGALTVEVSPGAWLLSAAANYRDGQPTVTFARNELGGLVFGQYSQSRLSGALTVDLRAKWRYPLGDGSVSVIGQVNNLFNRASCCSEFAPLPGSPTDRPQLTLKKHGSLPAIPWLGVSWDF